MDLGKITLFSAMSGRMAYLSERQSVLAENIANANTPGYQAMDVKEASFEQFLQRGSSSLAPAVTRPGHMSMSTGEGNFAKQEQKSSFDITPTGNSVVLEEQMIKMNETAMNYEATTMLYKKMTLMMSSAIGDR